MATATKAPSSAALQQIKDIVGPRGWTQDPAEIAPHLVDQRGLHGGRTPLVVRPASTDEVSRVVAACAAAGVAIVPQGGNTGLCGGALPGQQGHEIVLTLGRMNRIRALDALNYAAVVEAGCILANIQKAAADADRLFPLSLGAEGTCQIGGNLSTNAGGVGVLRYGMARDLVLGLEVVLPDGRVWNGLNALRKDNTGYDLKHLFVGAEGTLGIITAAALKLYPRPRSVETAFVAVRDPAAAIELLARARGASGDAVTAFELIPRIGLDAVLRHIPGTSDPLSAPHDWYVLAELSSGDSGERLRAALEQLLAEAMDAGLVRDAALAANTQQARAFWRIRETIPEARRHVGASIAHDVSVPVSRIAEFLEHAGAACAAAVPGCRIVAFGHVGDGNIHYAVAAPDGADGKAFLARWHEVNRVVHDVVMAMGGSFSAEHGIGRLKREDLAHYEPPVALDLMRTLKRALDPQGIMNPGKVL